MPDPDDFLSDDDITAWQANNAIAAATHTPTETTDPDIDRALTEGVFPAPGQYLSPAELIARALATEAAPRAVRRSMPPQWRANNERLLAEARRRGLIPPR